MEIKALYRYVRPDGGITVSPIKPNCDYSEKYRIIAGKDKSVTLNGIDLYKSYEADFFEGWYEVDNPEIIDEDIQLLREKAKAYRNWNN